MITSTIKITAINFIYNIIYPAIFSVLDTLFSMTFLMSLSVSSSRLILYSFAIDLDCSMLGDVCPVSQFEIVCLVTFSLSAASS